MARFFAQDGALPLDVVVTPCYAHDYVSTYISPQKGFKIERLGNERLSISGRRAIGEAPFNQLASAEAGVLIFGAAIICQKGELSEGMMLDLVGVETVRIDQVATAWGENDQVMISSISVEPKVDSGVDGIRTAHPNEAPEFWGVYKSIHALCDGPGGTWEHLKDFDSMEAAASFANDALDGPDYKKISLADFRNLDTGTHIYQADNREEPYTAGEFVALCDGDIEIACRLYQFCSWECPETALLEDMHDREEDQCFQKSLG